MPFTDLPPSDDSVYERDFRASFNWRVFRIMAELVGGWQFLADFHRAVTIFGSARFKAHNKWYKEARKLSKMLADNGYSIITGGGPGIMEAANRGAKDALKEANGNKNKVGSSIGLNIQLPYEQKANSYISKGIEFNYFFVRKIMLSYYAQAYVFFPGGYGTLDEAFEILTLVQVGKMPRIPIIFVGKDYWKHFADLFEKILYKSFAAIDKDDLSLFAVVDNAQEALELIKKSPQRTKFG